MALINCPECGKEVSNAAETCPHCGIKLLSLAALKAAGNKNKGKVNSAAEKIVKTKFFKIFFGTMLGIILFSVIIGICSPSPEVKKEEPVKQLTPEQARATLIDKQFSAWDGSHITLERMIKEGMNDPDSYEHVKTTYTEKGDYLIVTTSFRGKNAFGGKVLNSVTAKVDLLGNVVKIISQ